MPSLRAVSLTPRPYAANKTIRARSASFCGVEWALTSAFSSRSCSDDSSNGEAFYAGIRPPFLWSGGLMASLPGFPYPGQQHRNSNFRGLWQRKIDPPPRPSSPFAAGCPQTLRPYASSAAALLPSIRAAREIRQELHRNAAEPAPPRQRRDIERGRQPSATCCDLRILAPGIADIVRSRIQ